MNRLLRACSIATVVAASWTMQPNGPTPNGPTPNGQDPKPAAKPHAAKLHKAKPHAAKDRAAVERAALDYVEALYEAKPERIERSVHPKLKKFGFYRPEDAPSYRGSAMTFDQLVKLAGRWNKSGKNADANSPKKVEVLDLMDTTAVVKLTAVWGIDHMQLAKFDGRWQILHILWQSHPAKK